MYIMRYKQKEKMIPINAFEAQMAELTVGPLSPIKDAFDNWCKENPDCTIHNVQVIVVGFPANNRIIITYKKAESN